MPRRAADTYLESWPEFGRTVRVREYDRPMRSDDEETAQTIAFMDEIASIDCNDPAVIAATADALEDAGIELDAPAYQKACAVYWWLKRTVRYVNTPGTSPLVDQTLITPTAVLAMPEPIGDCPQFSMLAAAMFRVLCMDSLFVTIKAEREAPEQWSHVYNTVEVFPGQYLPFDSSNGPEPGAEYARPYARKVWPRIAPGRCGERSKEVMLRAAAARVPSMRNRALRGALGDVTCDDQGNCTDNTTGDYYPASSTAAPDTVAPGTYAAGYTDPYAPGGSLNPIATPPTSSSSGPSWLNTLITDVGNIGTSLVKSATQQKPYYVTNAQGQQVLYNPNTGTTVSTSSISPTVLLFGALAIGAVVLFSGRK